jgi:hypothetical protein
MSRSLKVAAVLAFAVVATSGLVVLAAGKPAPDVPVVATLADNANGHALRVGSDGGGAYLTTSQVTSRIQTFANGSDWMLTTFYTSKRKYAASNRGVLLDLSEQVTDGAFTTPIDQPTVVPVHLIAHCSRVNVDMVRMSPGQFAACPGGLRFWAPDGLWYRLSFGPTNYAVDPLRVTCITADTTGCKVWTITPNGTATTGTDPNPKNYTKLLNIDEGGNVLAEGGDYYVSFSITVAR